MCGTLKVKNEEESFFEKQLNQRFSDGVELKTIDDVIKELDYQAWMLGRTPSKRSELLKMRNDIIKELKSLLNIMTQDVIHRITLDQLRVSFLNGNETHFSNELPF